MADRNLSRRNGGILGLCDLCGVRSIVESGRGEHAYSSQILGEYSEQKDVEVVSIDLNPIEGKGFHERLERYRKIRYVVGNAFDVLPRAVQVLMALLLCYSTVLRCSLQTGFPSWRR